MPNIRITDKNYADVKAWADKEMRTVANATEYLLMKGLEAVSSGVGSPIGGDTSPTETPLTPENTIDLETAREHNPQPHPDFVPGEKISEATPRGIGEVLAEIQALTDKKDEDLEYCQDREMASQIEKQYKADTSPLWDEFKALKGE